MDDNQFDDILKKKMSEYHEPGFDPVALADLHYRMAAVDVVWPWYSRYRTELLVSAGLILCTLIILWNQWSLSSKENMLINDNLQALKNQDEQINKLQNEIVYLKDVRPDTVRIIEFREQNSIQYASLLNRISVLEATIESYLHKPTEDNTLSIQDSPESIRKYTSVTESHRTYSTRLAPKRRDVKSFRLPWDDKNAIELKEETSLSAKAIRDIEKHYQKGIGIRVGPTLEFSNGIYSSGNGRIDVAGGLLVDFILSPSVSLETGGKFAHRVYQVSGQEDLSTAQLPRLNESLGEPKSADIDSWILEIPINLKYRYPVSLRTHWLTGVGLSPMLFTKQVFEYDYELSGNSSASIYSIYRHEKAELYSGTLNISLGLSNETKRKNIVETSIYYQHGLGSSGVENIRRSFLGVRGVYWFKIR